MIAIEPMVNEGTHEIRTLGDNWTVVTADGKLSAHIEHTVAVGANGPDYFFETGRTLTNSIDIAGGSKVSTYRLGYTNTDQKGIMPNSTLKKHNFNFNGSYDVWDNVTVSASVNYTNHVLFAMPY